MKRHLEEIIRENKGDEEWSEISSSDWFQSENYCGGFDGIEMEFTFSFYHQDGTEYWFQFPLSVVPIAVANPNFAFDACPAQR